MLASSSEFIGGLGGTAEDLQPRRLVASTSLHIEERNGMHNTLRYFIDIAAIACEHQLKARMDLLVVLDIPDGAYIDTLDAEVRIRPHYHRLRN